MRWYFGFFFVSGFCSILYELVWLRLAMAQFAVTSALVSIVLSAFMVGLGLGSWGVGSYLSGGPARPAWFGLRLYAMTELLIGLSAILVPRELVWGRVLLERVVLSSQHGNTLFYCLAGLWIGIALVPWCIAIGATFPLAMFAIRQRLPEESPQSFSYLYVANLCGAMVGTVVPLILIEKGGFTATLHAGALLNLCLAGCALALSLNTKSAAGVAPPKAAPMASEPASGELLLGLLFGTGLTSMGAEVAWVRLFTPSLGTMVYAFAFILAFYLGATFLGSLIYRRQWVRLDVTNPMVWMLLGLASLLPLVVCDPRLPGLVSPFRIFSIIPFSLIVGFVTPMILDRLSGGDPGRAGRGYATNILGCVLGPLIAGFFLLPLMGEWFAIWVLAAPWFLTALWALMRSTRGTGRGSLAWRAALTSAAVIGVGFTKGYETRFSPREVRYDNTATVVAAGATRTEKFLLVNGVGMTGLSPVTKMMAHLPLVFLPREPHDALVICFGMGTTHRSMLSWGIHSTAVELVPSVPKVFPFFHADAEQLVKSPRSRIIVNDGRFFLDRTTEQFDVIVTDPPPPVEAAASSLLYSEEFLAIVRRHLRPGGILQEWFPQGPPDPTALAAVARALRESFRYVRVFHSVEGWGYHFLASDSPLVGGTAAELAKRLPTDAARDIVEWGPATTPEAQLALVLGNELSLDALISAAVGVPAMHDDHPVNEYFLWRRMHDDDYRNEIWQRVQRKFKRSLSGDAAGSAKGT